MALAVRRIRNCRFAGAEPTLRLYRTRHIRGSADYGEYPISGPAHHSNPSQYTENDSTDVLVIIGNDIREHLQAIVDGKPFNTHYNYILKKYLCGNPDIAVTVNNSKKNDFYSYRQGLKIIARRKTLIDEVFVDMGDNLNNECVMQLMVTQHEHFSEQKNK